MIIGSPSVADDVYFSINLSSCNHCFHPAGVIIPFLPVNPKRNQKKFKTARRDAIIPAQVCFAFSKTFDFQSSISFDLARHYSLLSRMFAQLRNSANIIETPKTNR
jgi:hypothetical protein